MNPEVAELLVAVHACQARMQQQWVPWSCVTRERYGADTPGLRALAQGVAATAPNFFASNPAVVSLTPAGNAALNGLPPRGAVPLDTPEGIADAVRSYAAQLQPMRLKVMAASAGIHQQDRYWQHALTVEAEEDSDASATAATDTPVTLRTAGDGRIAGKIVGQESDGSVMYVAMEQQIWGVHLPGVLEVNRAFLLLQLQERLRALPQVPPLAKALLEPVAARGLDVLANHDSVELADGLATLGTPWARFLWGPPGSGKTYGIGRLLRRLLKDHQGEQHLVVAPSNRATDVTVLQFLLHCQDDGTVKRLINERQVLRFGYPRIAEVMEQSALRGPAELENLHAEERDVSRRIREAEHQHESEEHLAGLRTERLAIQERIREAAGQHVRTCAVVFTTSTLAYLPGSPIGDIEWSSVFVDEVTMVPPAQCVFLGSLAQRRLLLAGDPRQLGPVYESHADGRGSREWLGTDIFEKAGVSRMQEGRRQICMDDERLTRIDSQRRCCDGIWSRVQHLYPQVESITKEEGITWLTGLPPDPGNPVVVIDTVALNARCERVHGSWRNEGTADLAMEVACEAVGFASRPISIAIITPYRAQVRLVGKRVREEMRSRNEAYCRIDVGSIHQFQGSEADYVIFDLVDGPGRPGLGVLTRDAAGERLVNVAITRARGKVVLLLNKGWMWDQRASNPLLSDVVFGPKWRQLWDGRDAMPAVPAGQTPPETPIERALRQAMLAHGELKDAVSQHLIRDEHDHQVSRADFAFPDLKYAVYCDGAEWHLRHDRWQRDLRLRNRLAELGWVFSVFTGAELNDDAAKCAEQVARTHQQRREETR